MSKYGMGAAGSIAATRARFPYLSCIRELRFNWELLGQLTARDVVGRYRGSLLGMAWSFLNPILMLVVYTLVFSQVFKAKWGTTGADQSPIDFAVNLFAGLLVFNLFAECANRGPSLITSNPNYVKKVVFPLEMLCGMCVGTAMFHALVGTTILLITILIYYGSIPWSILALPMVWLPLIFGGLGLAILLAAAGVFARDISQVTNVGVSMLMFLSPVFYPSSAVPEGLQWMVKVNPLAVIIEHTRDVLIKGELPHPFLLITEAFFAIVFCEVAFRLFKRVKPYFGDAL